MKYFMKIFKESIIVVILSSIFGLISGTLLSSNEEILYTIPILLLILPALNSLIGDISTVLVSRLTTHLYIGTILPKIQKSKRLKDDFYGLLIGLYFLLIVAFAFFAEARRSLFPPYVGSCGCVTRLQNSLYATAR